MEKEISSRHNEFYKYLLSLKEKKGRDSTNKFLLFGEKHINIALELNLIDKLITTEHNKESDYIITPELMKNLSYNKTEYTVCAVVNKQSLQIKETNKILALDGIQDPNNLGSLIRSAIGFGFETILISEETSDIYNEKTIRSSAGSILFANILRVNLYPKLLTLKEKGYNIIGTHQDGKDIFDNNSKIVLVLGNEGHGINVNIKNICDYFLGIKTTKIESLNVVVAGSILMEKLR